MADQGSVTRNVLADQIRDHLLQGIFSGQFPPDARIVETRIARDLGTSQAPVREALRGLEALGVVEILPFKGARVRRASRSEILEAYEVRSSLETLGARLGVPQMTAEDLAEITALNEAMQAAAASGDGRLLAEADATFHGRILGLAGNGTLERVWRSLQPFSRTYITLLAPFADARWSADLHAPIVAALRRRDTPAVEEALRRHFAEVADRMRRNLEALDFGD